MKAFKIRLYPNKAQEQIMIRHIGSCRFIWNWALHEQQENYKKGNQILSYKSIAKRLTALKQKEENKWLYEVSNSSLQTVCRSLDKAFLSFFKGKTGYPKYKSKKKDSLSYPVRCDSIHFVDEKLIHIPKAGKMKYKTNFSFGKETKISNGRITKVRNKWILSFSVEYENQVQELTNCSMGIDLGIKELAVVEFNGQCKVFHNINKSKKMKKLNKKLKYYQRKVSRQYRTNPKNKSGSEAKGTKWEKSKNIVKTEDKIKRIYAKITNIRQNYIHQTTHELVEMLPYRIVMEDLNILGLMKNKHMSRVVKESKWGEFIWQMKYKCEWNGIEFVQANRFYPSSKTCSCCGNIKKDLKLKDRTYICDICRLTIDRDYNAAINLSKYKVC